MSVVARLARPALGALLLGVFALGALPAAAQFDPPSTIYGSVTDAAGNVPEGLEVEAYIGDVLCGTRGATEYTGDGSARVTVYVVDVVSASQIAGCGVGGARVRIKIGDRFAEETAAWQAGPVQFDVTFGGASPAPIPTFTPLPTRTPEPTSAPGTPNPNGETPTNNQTPGAVETIPPGSPGAGSPVTRPGGVTSSDPNAQESGSSDGGFPVWGVVALLLGGIAAIGGGVGVMMARNRREEELAEFEGFGDAYTPPPTDQRED